MTSSLHSVVLRWFATTGACIVLLAAGVASAQDEATRARATGDAWVDAALDDIDDYAARHRDPFVDELVRYQASPRTLAEESLSADTTPGDLYFACAMAQALGRPCRELLDARRADASAGWADIARQADAKQAGTALARVKRGIVASYDRWGRPIELDASLRRALPKRKPDR